MEDRIVIGDHRSLNTGQSTRYDQFLEECDKYLNENTAINDRRHGTVAHLALALSVQDLIEQVKGRYHSEELIFFSQVGKDAVLA